MNWIIFLIHITMATQIPSGGAIFDLVDAMKRVLIVFVVLFLWTCPPAMAEETIRISTSYQSLLSNPEETGMLDRIVVEAFHRIGVKADIVFTNTRRSLVAVNDGLLDGELNRIEGMEQKFPNLVRVPEPNMQMRFVAFAKRDIPIANWDSLRGLRIGFVQGWKILERHTKGFPNVTRLPDVSTLFRMLHIGRLDAVLYSKLTGYEHLHELGYTDIHHLSPPLAVKDMFLYLHKSRENLAGPVAAALREMKQDGTYGAIVSETTGHLQ